MKKTILLALLIFLIPSLCLAGSVQDKLKAVVKAKSGAACATVVDYSTGDTGSTVVGSAAATFYRAYSFTTPADGGGTIKSISFLLGKNGTPGSDLSGKICTDNSAKPSTTCVNATATIPSTGLTTTPVTKKFSWAGYAYSQSTRYWFVMSATVADASNDYIVRYNSAGSEIVSNSAETPISWSNLDSTSLGQMLVSQCE